MNDYSGNFDLNTASSFPMWLGRVVSNPSWEDNIESEHFDPKDQKGWGYRYRVRYFGLHSASTKDLPDNQLPMANLVLPVTGGSGLGGFVDTPTLSDGSIVVGFFLDGMSCQEPYIFGVLINSNNSVPKDQPNDETGGLQLFNNSYIGASPQRGSFVPDHLQATIPIERPSVASTEYKLSRQTPLTIDELRARTAAREAAGPQVGDVVTNQETLNLIEQERQIGLTGNI